MSWSGYDSNGNFIWLEENPTPEDYASCGTIAACALGLVVCVYFVYKYWPLVLGCAIVSFVIAAAAAAARSSFPVRLINTLWMSAVFIIFSLTATELFTFDGGILNTVANVIGLVAEVPMAGFISLITGWLAGKIFRRK